jgi:Lrp/AsnC family transcriptional regulator, regulator for asnA, asnC and gidA
MTFIDSMSGESNGMIDRVDKKIIWELQKDGRASYNEIAEKLGLSTSTVFRHVRRLIKEDVICITAIPDPYKIGRSTVASFGICVDLKKMDTVAKHLATFPEIHLLAFTYGHFDISGWIQTYSAESLHELTRNIAKIDGVVDMETSIWAQMPKRSYGWLSYKEIM